MRRKFKMKVVLCGLSNHGDFADKSVCGNVDFW